MAIVLFLLSVLAGLAAFGAMLTARSAVHEAVAAALWVVAAVLFSGAAIVGAIHSGVRRILARLPAAPATAAGAEAGKKGPYSEDLVV